MKENHCEKQPCLNRCFKILWFLSSTFIPFTEKELLCSLLTDSHWYLLLFLFFNSDHFQSMAFDPRCPRQRNAPCAIEIGCNFLIPFINVFRSIEFKSSLLMSSKNFGDFLHWLTSISVAATNELCSIAKQKFPLSPYDAVFDFLAMLGPVFCVSISHNKFANSSSAHLDSMPSPISLSVLKISSEIFLCSETVHYVSSTLVSTFSFWLLLSGKRACQISC